jgi:hypothetical protein
MPISNPPRERHPTWIIALAIIVCLAGLGAMIFSLANSHYTPALGFLVLAIVGALLPRVRNLVIQFSLREQAGTVAVNAPEGAVEDRLSQQRAQERDEPDR